MSWILTCEHLAWFGDTNKQLVRLHQPMGIWVIATGPPQLFGPHHVLYIGGSLIPYALIVY